MTIEEAIRILDPETTKEELVGIKGYAAMMKVVDEACILAVAALREQEERENVWHDAKNSPPQKPGVYYGKVDDTDSMFACQYRAGVWTLNAYPGTRMPITEWAYYDAFVREDEERRWIPVTERLPDENNRWVLCLCVSGAIEVLKFDYTMWNWDAQYPGRCYMENYVTHWMPLPKPPKEK